MMASGSPAVQWEGSHWADGGGNRVTTFWTRTSGRLWIHVRLLPSWAIWGVLLMRQSRAPRPPPDVTALGGGRC